MQSINKFDLYYTDKITEEERLTILKNIYEKSFMP